MGNKIGTTKGSTRKWKKEPGVNDIGNTLRQSKVKGRGRNKFYKLEEKGWNIDVQYKPSTACASLTFGAISYQELSGGKKRKSWQQKATRVILIFSVRSAPEPRTQISVARRDRWSRKREASNLMIKSFILVYPFKNSSLFSRQVSAHTHRMKKLWSLVT